MGCSAGGHRVPGLSPETHCGAGLGLHRLFSSPCGKSRRPRRLGTRRFWSGGHLLRGFLLWGGGDRLPALPPPSPRSRAGCGSHTRGGRRGGRRLRSPGAAGGCGGGRRPRERSARSRWPASLFLQRGGSAGGAVALETSTLPACGHFRILYACVTSCFLPSFHLFFFPEASPARSRGTLVPSLFWWIFVFFRLVWFARSPRSPSGPGSGTPCRGSRPHVEVSGLRFAWPTWVPRLRGLLVLGKPAVLLQCWFAGKPIFTLWLRKERNIPTGGGSRGSPGHYCVRAWCRVL